MHEEDSPRFLCLVQISKGIIACTCGRCTWVSRVHDTDLAAGQVAFDGHRCEDFPRAREALSTA